MNGELSFCPEKDTNVMRIGACLKMAAGAFVSDVVSFWYEGYQNASYCSPEASVSHCERFVGASLLCVRIYKCAGAGARDTGWW